MSDLTDAELEAMEKRCALVKRAKYLPVRESLIITTEDIEQMTRTDLPALIAALREARGERDGFKAENRLLREWLNKATTKLCRLNIAWTWPSPDIAPLTAAEAERVRRMEAESRAARAYRDEYRKDFGARKDLGDNLHNLFQLLDEHDEAAALGEGDTDA